jgi:hypothetical protein
MVVFFFCVQLPPFAHAAHWEREKSGDLPKAEVCFWIRFLLLLCRFSVEIFYILSVLE